MLSSISPLGERTRRQRFWITATSYSVAATVAGAALASALGFAGATLHLDFDRTGAALLAAVCAAGITIDRGWFGLRVPGPRRQVDEDWLARYRGWVYGAGYGAQLGVGFATFVTSMLTWTVFAFAFLAGPIGGSLIGAAFGLTRAVPLWLTVRVRDAASLRRFMARLQLGAPQARRAVIATQLIAAVSLTGWAVA